VRRRMPPIALFLALLALAPVAACSASGRSGTESPARAGRVEAAAAPRETASQDELERYAERERSSAGLEKFEGGRIDTTSIVIILLLVIVIILIV
jgi:hypothetical protein